MSRELSKQGVINGYGTTGTSGNVNTSVLDMTGFERILLIGQQGTIVGNGWHIWQWEVRLDGNPEKGGFNSEHLEPIVNPDETAWNEFKRYLQPDPAVILAKEPA